MSLLALLRGAVSSGSAARPGCFPCAHFCDDPARVEAALPGLAALSSAHASVRGRDGLCLAQQRLVNGRRRCAAFAPALERADNRLQAD